MAPGATPVDAASGACSVYPAAIFVTQDVHQSFPGESGGPVRTYGLHLAGPTATIGWCHGLAKIIWTRDGARFWTVPGRASPGTGTRARPSGGSRRPPACP